jgi:site-specific DNA-methyltransferase (adenine-specific)
VAGINIDGCRIEGELPEGRLRHGGGKHSEHIKQLNPQAINSIPSGRWPANILFDEAAAEMLDQQSGNLGKSCGGKSGNYNAYSKGFNEEYYENKKPGLGDSGGASRFFYCAKSSSSERNAGLDELTEKKCERWPQSLDGNDKRYAAPKKNNHPTVKPIKLMEYLLKLVTPPNGGIVLDPFMGSGTTLLAAKRLNINAIGIEKSADYCEIAKGRLDAV